MPHRRLPPSRPRTSPAGRAAARASVLAAAAALAVSTGGLARASTAPGAPSSGGAMSGGASSGVTADFLTRAAPHGAQRVTAAVLDLDATHPRTTVYGDDLPYDTASIVKVDILAAALLRAQDAGHGLTAGQRQQAEVMIERSDNAAAGGLWREIGLAPGLAAANERLGLGATRGGPGGKWGLTRTTASDQVRLLRAVFAPDPAAPGALDAASRAYVRTLMSRVDGAQSWGVPAAGGSGAALKNGWLQRNTTGLWDVNSVGRITVGGHRCLVAVLSDGSPTMADGVALVERAARAAVAEPRT
ncbi:serine hydrolase [Streptomyces sp. NPDC026672]|uniref:serine hydrolase n=1 Tax=unclassified Streptomyces TaxID=2593676 RepID=UPI003404887E